jgi:hypothetical protein
VIGSLARLGVGADGIARRIAEFEGNGREAGATRGAAGRVPVRRLDAPLDLLPHLLPGYDRLPPAAREAWRAIERELPGGRLTIDLAWLACDGRRTAGEIGALVERESGVSAPVRGSGPASIESLFEWLAQLGLISWKENDPR